MFSHVTLGTDNWPRAKEFYQAITEVLELPLFLEREAGAAWGEMIGPKLFVGPAFDGAPASFGNGTHVPFWRSLERWSMRSTSQRWRMAGLMKANQACARIIIQIITALMSATLMAISYKPSAILRKHNYI